MQSRTLHSFHRSSLRAWSPLLPATGRPGHSVADTFRDSGQHREASDPTSIPYCKAPLNPGACGSPRTGAEAGADAVMRTEDVPTQAGRCCCAGFSGRCRRLGAEPSAGCTWPRSF